MIASRLWIGASVFALGTSLLFGQAPSHLKNRITQRIVESQITTLKGNTYPLARSEFDKGLAPADLPMERMILVLNQSDEQKRDLDSLIEKLHDPNSEQFHQWLTPEQFGDRFGISNEDVATVTGWLEARGFYVSSVAKGRTVLEFSGTAGQVADAFHTAIHKYNNDGEEHWANSSDPQIPTALAPVVAGVATLHNFVKRSAIRAPEVTGSPQYTLLTGAHYLSPGDFAVIYNANPLYQSGIDGSGRTIAVVARSNINVSDVNQFRNIFGLAVNSPQVVFNGADPGIVSGDKNETILDTTWAGAVAPGATIKLVVSKTTSTSDGVDLSEMYIINNNLADVMTESYGSCDVQTTAAQATLFSSLAAQAAAQGITYLVSAGDQGSAGCDASNAPIASGPLSVNMLASNPYVVAVGGTQFDDGGGNYWGSSAMVGNLSALSYIPESVWNRSCNIAQCGSTGAGLSAGGGGASIYYQKPTWQTGVIGIPADGARDIPDISLTASADIAPYLVCIDGSCSNGLGAAPRAFGGTSASAPAFAGIMALIVQKTNARQGQANFRLYQLAAAQDPTQCNSSLTNANAGCIFHDVTVGSNGVPGQAGYGTVDSKYQAGAGYDLASGLGSVNAANLVGAWSTAIPIGSRALSVSTSNLSFLNVLSGVSSTQTVWLVNAGSSPISIASISLAGNGSNAFAQTPGCSNTLGVGGSCSVTVTFAPRTTGSFAASLVISDDAPGSPHTVALSGTGVLSATLSLLPSSFDFGTQKLQLRSSSRRLQVANSTSQTIAIAGVTVSGANALDFQAANKCGSSLAPGTSCFVYIVFTPQLAGTRSATLSIANGPSGTLLTLSLTGAGVISGAFQIVNGKSGQVIDVATQGNGAIAQQDFLNGQLNQQWLFYPVDSGFFYIVNAASGKALDDTASSQANGAIVQQFDYLGGANQQWQLVAVDDVHYRIINRFSEKVLDLPSGSSVPGTAIQQWSSNGLAQQSWALMPVQSYTFLNKTSTAVLDLPGALGANGTFVQQFNVNGYRQQQWQLSPMGSGYYAILSSATGKALDVVGASSRNGALVQEYQFIGGFNQQWRVVQIDDSLCEIQNRLSGKVLDVPNSSISNGISIQQWDYLANGNQQWQLSPVTFYNIVSRASGKVLEVAGGSLANGGLIQQATATGSQQQRWQLLSSGGGSFAIQNDLTGMVMGVAGTSVADGAAIQQSTSSFGSNYQWLPLSLPGNFYALINRASGKALDVVGGSTASGAPLQQYAYFGSGNQQWALVQVNQ